MVKAEYGDAWELGAPADLAHATEIFRVDR